MQNIESTYFTKPKDLNQESIFKDSKNNRIFCPFCGGKNISNANFCNYCGSDFGNYFDRNMRLDSRDNVDSRDYRQLTYKSSILKYRGLLQILIGLHGLFLVILGAFLIFMGFSRTDLISGILILLPSAYIFYQYFRYKRRWTYYVFLVFFGILCIISFFCIFQNTLFLIIFILYLIVLWYVYECLRLD